MKDIIETAMLDLVRHYINTQQEFSIVLDNHNDWGSPLPDRLSAAKRFMLNVVETDLEDSFVDEDGTISIVAGIDDGVYQKTLKAHDLHSVGLVGIDPIIVKPYVETPTVVPTSPGVPTENGVAHSTACFKANNPGMFNEAL